MLGALTDRQVTRRQLRCARQALLGFAAWFAVPLAGAATQFTFTLDDAYVTSAAVYYDGRLLRTLTRGERLEAGPHTLTWDNRTDSGFDMAEEGPGYEDDEGNFVPYRYELRLLKHKIDYVWEGVIGNTSASLAGSTEIFRSFKPPQSLAIAGDTLHFTVGFNEWNSGAHSLRLSDPQRHLFPLDWQENSANPWDAFVDMSAVTTDGTRLYWANTGSGIQGQRTGFVVMSQIGSRHFSNFAAGQPTCLNYRAGFTAPVAGMNYWNYCHSGQYYPSVIDPNPDQVSASTGIAVQVNGPILAVAHGRQGQVRLFDKVSGAWLKTMAIPQSDIPLDASLNQLAMAPNGDLWVISGTSLLRYTDLTGEPSLAATIPGFARPLAVAVHPVNDDIVLVADGDVSQQVKAFSRDGQSLWVFGRPGGYVWSPQVTTDKLGFKLTPLMMDTSPVTLEQTSLAVQADGSFWVVDTSNGRMLHIGADLTYREQVAYLPAHYAVTVDPNNPRRVFSTFLEFEVDHATSRLEQGQGPSWRLVRNWHAAFPQMQPKGSWNSINRRYAGLNTVVTLSNGRTYALASAKEIGGTNPRETQQLVELPAWGPARDTGITMRSACPQTGDWGPSCVMYENGDLGYMLRAQLVNGANGTVSVVDAYQRVYRKPLVGFDAAGNPQWGAAQLVASVLANPREPSYRGTPYFHQAAWSGIVGPRFPITESNRVVFFDPNVFLGSESNGTHIWRNDGFHLGAVGLGEQSWSWMGSPTGWLDGKGSFQTQAIDSSIHYGGNLVWAQGKHIVYGFHGEFHIDRASGLQGQANQFMHFHEDGLFIGQFGKPLLMPWPREIGTEPEQAGNAFGNILLPAGPDSLYWYHNDESAQGGVHRWRIDNINSAVVWRGAGVLDSTISVLPTPP